MPTSPLSSTSDLGWNWSHSYSNLAPILFSKTTPTPVCAPQSVITNAQLADDLGLNASALESTAATLCFAGNSLPSGSNPIAQAYSGHQFGHFNHLGDGRAILIGEHMTPNGQRVDIQWKGAGTTPYSRRGDGRAALGPMLREYLISEAMHALGIPTTRSLAVISTGEPVYRDKILPGAILTRVASSHIRVGTFQWLAAQSLTQPLTDLTTYTLKRHYPNASLSNNPALELLKCTLESQASLVAKWLLVGFVHGVLNTDNVAISGETIDYGPCAFLDTYHNQASFSSIDSHGRYAYGQQAAITRWNLARFAEALIPVIDPNPQTAAQLANEIIQSFAATLQSHWCAGMSKKLGLFSHHSDDVSLFEDLFSWMQTHQADFTLTFRRLSDGTPPSEASFQDWHTRWQNRLANQPQSLTKAMQLMQENNPAVIPRNHHVESALHAAVENLDLVPMHQLLAAITSPYTTPANLTYALPPPLNTPPYQTYCGT